MSRAKAAVLKLLRAWQWTRRFRQPACRFYPSCSEYTRQAVEKHGLAAGMRLGVVRICKCHPFHDGGVDEVPDTVKPMFRGMSVRTALMQPEAGWQPALPGCREAASRALPNRYENRTKSRFSWNQR